MSIHPILPVNSSQMTSEASISGHYRVNEEPANGRPASAQEAIQRTTGFPETPPSPSIDERIDNRTTGWTSSLLDNRQGLVSPDLIDIEADDISNDSYLIDRDTKSLSNKISKSDLNYGLGQGHSNRDAIDHSFGHSDHRQSDDRLSLGTNLRSESLDSSKFSEDIEYVLHKRKVRKVSAKDKTERRRRAVSAPRIACRSERRLKSCQKLFARTDPSADLFSHSLTDNRMKRKKLHFVSLNSLPSLESYSARDDSLQDSEHNSILDHIYSNMKSKVQKSGVEGVSKSQRSQAGSFGGLLVELNGTNRSPGNERSQLLGSKSPERPSGKLESLFQLIIAHNLANFKLTLSDPLFEMKDELTSNRSDQSPGLWADPSAQSEREGILSRIIAFNLSQCFADDFDPNCCQTCPNQSKGTSFESNAVNLETLILRQYLRSMAT